MVYDGDGNNNSISMVYIWNKSENGFILKKSKVLENKRCINNEPTQQAHYVGLC